jgi:hypothetical protein
VTWTRKSELQYKYDNGLRSPTGSDTVHKREDGFPEEDTNDKEAEVDEVPTNDSNAIRDEHKDTATTLLAMTMATSTKRERSPLPNPAHLQRTAGSGTARGALSNLALDDPVVANLKQEMQEMKTIMRALLQGGVETGKKKTSKKASRPKEKGGTPQDEKARCALLKGKKVAEENAFALEDDDEEDFVSDDELGPRDALKAKLERLQKK